MLISSLTSIRALQQVASAFKSCVSTTLCGMHGYLDLMAAALTPRCPLPGLVPLQVLIQECFFTSAQARAIVKSFSYGEDKIDAAVKVGARELPRRILYSYCSSHSLSCLARRDAQLASAANRSPKCGQM